MSNKSKIEWTEVTWNPITGCTKISEGCANCYAERMAKRLNKMKNKRYLNGFDITIHDDLIGKPLEQKNSKMIFVCSMSDLFHEDISDEVIIRIFETMNLAHWHTFQVLTKRSHRLVEISNKLKFTKNIWIGVTVENSNNSYRINDINKIQAAVKFISFEPLIGDISTKTNLNGIDWVIVGGESGPGARPMRESYVKNIKTICDKENIPFFFKQWGGVNKKKTGRLLDGEFYNNYPKTE